ncbi:pyruvate dehydrogenase [acetyl-transferring]-phosphatase 1, mitochondrial [Anopheles aquasalis]|uniref:pyruvate dehydrogenase [acetyl-transferring]-phosphatase 1, mitochondrial n=1 Tax=Anopheles aquasalis TaxID=42839 RepID=UPI00215AB32B|nr:pyruvate dehydrogenase [acetyl-transferring]-phosphatase 1, mitochondrial [Anopheles aquasalis]
MTNLSLKILSLRSNVATAASFIRSIHHEPALHRSSGGPPKLSPYDVNNILRANEHTQEFFGGSVKCYDSNQLASNSPIEDSRSEASCAHTAGLLLGIFDGHGGPACSQVISKRLMRYIAASLVPPDDLRQHLLNGAQSYSFLNCHNDKLEFVTEIKELYEKSFLQFANELTNTTLAGFQMHQTLENAFIRLDQDLSREAMEMPSLRTMSVAMSGAVALVAHIDGPHLHVASVGDCSAVLGTVTDTGQWVAKKLTNEHNSDNVGEVRRLLSEHPATERDTVIRGERLLGQLAPLRAMGDFRYKWSREQLEQLVVPQFGEQVIAPYYHTPPYLSACPEITHHILTPRDKFLVIASDGLWDTMSAMQTVHLVGEHMYGKAFLQPLTLPKHDITLGEISQMLSTRKAGLQKKPLDRNAATHLIRNALGGTEYGVEHSKLSHMLSLPQDIVRLFRDDITITVVYFDSEYLRNCPT